MKKLTEAELRIKKYTDGKLEEMATLFANLGSTDSEEAYAEAYAKEKMLMQEIAAWNPELGQMIDPTNSQTTNSNE